MSGEKIDQKKESLIAVNVNFKKELPSSIAELCFTFLPFIVILIINLSKGNWTELLQTSNWALAATLMFGQTIVKLVMGLSAQEHSFNYQVFGLIAALIIVLGLVPSIVVLAIFIIQDQLNNGLLFIQFVLLAASIAVFLYMGTLGQVLYTTASLNRFSKMINKEMKETKRLLENGNT